MADDTGDYLLLYGNQLPEQFVLSDGSRPAAIGPLEYITILVGANSSGKSRLMRSLAFQGNYVVGTKDVVQRVASAIEAAEHIGKMSTAILGDFRVERRGDDSVLLGTERQREIRLLPATFSEAAKYIRLRANGGAVAGSSANDFYNATIIADLFARGLDKDYKGPDHVTWPRGRPDFEALRICGNMGGIRGALDALKSISPQRTYIPALRSGHTIVRVDNPHERVNEDLFAATWRARYNAGRMDRFDLFTGHDLYSRLMAHQCAPRGERERKLAFELFLSHRLFEGKELELVAQLGKDPKGPLDGHVNFRLGGHERELYNVGDGIAAVTTLLYPVFMAPEGTWVFMEEPENHLHPAFQRIVLDALMAQAEERRIRAVIATHSNHLLDVAMEYPDKISVLALSPEREQERTEIRYVQDRDVRVLDSLGVRNGSVYLANCSIWVEGPSDVLYLRAYLDVLMQERFRDERPYKEDLHYTFVEYGGSLLAHWGFGGEDDAMLNAAAVANRICVVADRDVGKETKHQEWAERVAKCAGALSYLTTTGREIENDISPDIFRNVLTSKLHLDTVPNEIAVTVCPFEEYVGDFLVRIFADNEAILSVVSKWRDGTYGTLKSRVKVSLAKRTQRELGKVWSIADRKALAGNSAMALAGGVLDFIVRHNRS